MKVASRLVLLLVVAVSFACKTVKPVNPVADKPSFAGTYLYNFELSDNSRQRVREVLGPEGVDVGDIKDDRKEVFRRNINRLTDAPEILRVDYEGSKMIVTGGNGFRREYQLGPSGAAAGAVRWEGETLVAEVDADRGKITESFELTSSRRQLFMTVKLEVAGFDRPIVVRRVYDREL